MEATVDVLYPATTLIDNLRATWTDSRGSLQHQLNLFERGYLDAVITPEDRAAVEHSFRAGIALYDGLLQLQTMG